MASRYQLLEQEYDDRYAAGEFNVPTGELPAGERRNVFAQYPGEQREFLTSILEEEDPLWSDYGKMVMSGGVQIGAGVGWLFNNFEWGESLQAGAMDLSQSFMDDLSPQARRAMQTEFTSRDEGQLWTNNKWSKAKLIAAQSLLGTAAGMGAGSILTRGLAAAGMTKVVQTAAGAVQVPTRTAGAIGYGLGEAGVAAPGSAAGVEEEIMAMSHTDLIDNADYRAVYLALENADPAERARRAKEILAKAAAGDTFYRNMVSTFILSAPLGALVGGYARRYPILGGTTRPKAVGIGALGEATQEFLQSGAEKRGENIAMQRAGFDRPTYEGVLEEAVGGAMAGGLMGGTFGVATPLDPTGQVLPDAASPLAALANVEQDELDAALDAELADQFRLEREEEDAALRAMLAEEDEATRAIEMTATFGEREGTLEVQREAQIREEFRRQEAREARARGPLPGEPETEEQEQIREYEEELREVWDIDKEEERFRRLEALQKDFDKGRLPHLRTLSPAERITPAGQRQDEAELFLEGAQPAEGEVVAGLPVPTAGRAGVPLRAALEEAQKLAALAPTPPPPTVTSRRKGKMGEPTVREELVEPPKPDIPPTTKAFNPRRDNIIIAAAKMGGLDKDAWAAEGVDPAEFRAEENAYGSRRAFRAGGMTPDEATEWAGELGFVPVDEHGKPEVHAALDAIMATLGGDPVFTAEGAQFAGEAEEYQRQLDEQSREIQLREDIVGEWDIEVDGVEAHITENTIGDVTVQIGDDETITERMTPDESNRDLVRAILQSKVAREGEIREKPVEGAPQTEEEQIAFERSEGKRIVDEMIPGESGMVETTEEKVQDLEDAFFADGWKFDAVEQSYKKDNRVAQLQEIEEGRWQVIWETEGAPEIEPEEVDIFAAPELEDVADDLGDQISRLTPESSSTDRNMAIADLGRLKRARHPRADDLAQRLKEALGEAEPETQFPLSAEEIRELDLDQIARDTIGAQSISEDRIKKPVVLGGRQFIVSGYGMDRYSFVEVIPADAYEGETTTYSETTSVTGQLAQKGYEGIRVKYRGKDFVLGKSWDLKQDGSVKADRRGAAPAAPQGPAVTAPAAAAQEFNLDWMPATMRVRILGDSAESFSRMDKTSLQAYAIRIGTSDQGTKIEIAQRIKDAVATLPTTEIDEVAAQEVADMVERKAKYATKKKLTKIQKEALVTAVALSQITSDGEVLIDDLSARNVGGQAIDGLVQKGAIELVGGEGRYWTADAKFKVKYMPAPEHPMARRAVPVRQPIEGGIVEEEEVVPTPIEARRERLREIRNMADRRQEDIDEGQDLVDRRGEPARREDDRSIEQKLFSLEGKIKEKYGLDSFEVAINNDGEIELYDIDVPVGLQNQQRGSRAIRELSEFADENKLVIRLEPALSQEDLAPREGLDRFYRRLGFTPDETLAGFYLRQPGELTEDELADRLEREAIEAEEGFDTREQEYDVELGDIPGFEDLEAETATSPESDTPMPTEDQKEAGNYKKAHITIKGILISIENAVGSIRNGFRMKDHYGYIKRTEGVDGDQVDVFVNPNIQIDYNDNVYIIDQTDAQGQFDEHKVMLGYASELDAVKAYSSNYEKGWTVGPVTEMSMANFKFWLADDAATKRPAKGRGTTRKQEQAVRRVKRGLRASRKVRSDNRVEDAKESVNAPNKKWVAETLRKLPALAKASDEAIDTLVNDLVTLEEALGELEVQEAVVRDYDRPQVERDTKQLRDAVEGTTIAVLDDYTQAPAAVVKEMEEEKMTDVAGVTDPRTGDIYIFSDKIVNGAHANRVTIHEITHSGLRVAFGTELDSMLLDLGNNVPPALQTLSDEITETYEFDLNKNSDKIEMAEELVAHGAEDFPNLPIIKKFIAKIRRMLRNRGFVREWTENDVIGLIKEAQGAIKRRGRSLEGITFDEEVEVEETGEVFTIERDAQDSLDQNEKRQKVCQRIKKCL